ncbi:ribonuclease HI [Desulfonauticus submarinus]|uniref:Ribonuclease H n=1 Tax=Desulfonauticus submarinus TaxID=206665 RepID=A0A1H0CPT2_9BACT|nr:ribonuclease HI [Desulfonauticus submarinus]SDN59912.1 ribonuclease HI [Desulfonauticus submarinus]
MKVNNLPEVYLFTDGCSLGNPGPGGIGVILKYKNKSKKIQKGFTSTTNNRMELQAIIEGLMALKKPCKVTVFTDSQYVVKAFNEGWLKNWLKNNWKNASKKPVKNKDLWEKLLQLTQKHTVTFEWIKGHNNHPENEECDSLAKAAAQKIKEEA